MIFWNKKGREFIQIDSFIVSCTFTASKMIFLISLSLRTCCVSCWGIRPPEELLCQPIVLDFSVIASILHWFWLHRYNFRCFWALSWKVLKIKPAGTFLKACICAHRGVIHISFYKDVQTQVSPSAWGNFLGSLRSENCHHCPAGDSWSAWEGPFVLRGTEREQHSHVSTGGKCCKMPFGNGPCKDKQNSQAFKNSNK